MTRWASVFAVLTACALALASLVLAVRLIAELLGVGL
jgi:hypothetical protein